jgi:tape measure domain-containing protein
MAIEVATAYVSILPETSKIAPGIKSAFGSAQREGASAGGRSGSSFAAEFKRRAGAALKVGLLAGVGGVTALGAAGLKTAADLEQSKIGFTTMLGSAKAANDFMKQITKTAANTPFELPGLTSSAQKLLAFGIQAKDVIPTLTTLGDAAAGLGAGQDGLDQIVMALGQIQAKGKVQSDELLQMTEAGIPALKILANQMGRTTGDLQKQISTGIGVTAKQAIPLLLNGLKKGTKGINGQTVAFGGLMQKQSQSLSGLFSTLKDTVLVGVAKAIQPLLPMLKNGLTKAIAAIGPAIQRAGKWLAEFVKGMRDGTGAGGKFASIVKGTAKVVGGLVGFMKKWQDVLVPVAGGILAIVGALKVWRMITATATAVQAAFNFVLAANPIGLIVLAVIGLGTALVIAYKKSETFRNIVNGAFGAIRTSAVAIAHFFTQKIPAAFGKVKDAAGRALGWVRQNWPKILAILTGPIGLAVYAIAKNWTKIKNGVSAVKDFVVSKFDAIVTFVKGLPGKIGKAAAGMWNGIRDSFRAVMNWLIGKWNNFSITIDIPDKIPGLPDDFTLSTPDLPYFAKGGVVNKATLGVFGEAGPEAVVPLDRLDSMLGRASAQGANAEARRYTNPTPGSGSARRTEFVITNWKTGEGYFREIAEDTYADENDHADRRRRMQ